MEVCFPFYFEWTPNCEKPCSDKARLVCMYVYLRAQNNEASRDTTVIQVGPI